MKPDQIRFDAAPATTGFVVQEFKNATSDFSWVAAGSAIGPALVQGATAVLAASGEPFKFTAGEQHKDDLGLDRLAGQWVRPDGLKMSWSARKWADTGVFEFATVLANTGSAPIPQVSQLGPLCMRLNAPAQDLTVHFVSRQHYGKTEAPLASVPAVAGGGWNAPDSCGWIAIENKKAGEVLFLGVMWESYWKVTFEPQGNEVLVTCRLEGMGHDLAPQESFSSPALLVGLCHGDIDDSLRQWHDHLRKHVITPPPADFPWVSYDMYGTEATGVEDWIAGEIPIAKELGVELFYIDASWYEGSAKNGSGDWFSGVGNYLKEDRVKFPLGLAEMSRKVHAAGMKFALWFGPEVCDARLVGNVIPKEWIAQSGGKDITLDLGNGWPTITQVCLGDPRVAEHLKNAISQAIEKFDLDWVKWDVSGLPGAVCNRPDHGHGANDGALQCLRNEYECWRYLHKKYPKVSLEQCGYPCRMDYGLAPYMRANWLGDATEPAQLVRHNLINASYVYPAAFNETYVTRCAEIEHEKDPAVLDTIIRSRMAGLFGFCTLIAKMSERVSQYSPEVLAAIKRNIPVYKKYRHLLLNGDVYHLLPAASSPDAWDAIEFSARDGSEAVVLAFRSGSEQARQTLRLRGLDPLGVYTVTSANSGQSRQVTATELTDAGLAVDLPTKQMSDVFLIKREKRNPNRMARTDALKALAAPAGGNGAQTKVEGPSVMKTELDKLVGQPVDIAPSAYQYRADRKAQENPPESYLALMRYANQPLNKPLDANAPAIKQALCGLLWEEIRPVRQLELTWVPDAKHRPAPEELTITTLDNRGTASSWWNNLEAAPKPAKPSVSTDGNTYVYDLQTATCGIVISVGGSKSAADYAVPAVRVLVADRWKKMDVEIEWGFDQATARKDYSGRVEIYDGRAAGLRPLDGDTRTTGVDATSWHSGGKGLARRGVKFSLLYMGTSRWRQVQPFTSQRDDVARTIVTVWTKAGNFSFLAGDLENGPILAPEYGFFVRRLPEAATASAQPALNPRVPLDLMTAKTDSIAGSKELPGWGSDLCPWFGGNPADKPVSVQSITIPARSLAMHPGADRNVVVGWRSPIKGVVKVKAGVAHAQSGGDGIEWWIARENKTDRKNLAQGTTGGTGRQTIPAEADAQKLAEVAVEPGDMVSLVVGRKGTHFCDMTLIELVITEVGGRGRVWNLTQDVVSTLHAGNPHADGQGNADVWHFYSEDMSASFPSQPPITLASQAASAREFIKELQARKLTTIRQQIRVHAEQTWEGAVTAMRGANLPPHPKPPAGSEPAMQVQVPPDRLTAQWNLGAWHLVRHAQKNPKTGRLWFDDYPYGILGEETYMILAALDLMGSHQAAADGFDQWVSLPMDTNSVGHNPGALPDRPNGLFSDGHGCLTNAVGPASLGGQMDGVHAFGPGSIGWALTQHYWMTGDVEWLKASAPRIKANAEWMLRQRQVVSNMVPGGDRLWCKGLQPALQVTPDSGGLWMQFYESEAYYWASVSRLAATLAVIDPKGGAKLAAEAETYRKDLRAAVERSIALSPVVPVRDGTFHSVIPFACYVRGLGTGAWGWQRDGSGADRGPLYWEATRTAATLVSPAGLLSVNDVRVQGWLDVLEDRLLLENPYVGQRDWFLAGWQYQVGAERIQNMHLSGDDIPVFLRSFLNGYAVDILPDQGYVFNEHAVHGPPDKIFEEAAFLERFRNLLVMEDGQNLWLARATPRAWLEQGKRISIKNAPTHFGTVDYEIVSDVDHGKIAATVKMPSRNTAKEVWLRLRHPRSSPIKGVVVNGKAWKDFDSAKEVVKLHNLKDTLSVEIQY